MVGLSTQFGHKNELLIIGFSTFLQATDILILRINTIMLR